MTEMAIPRPETRFIFRRIGNYSMEKNNMTTEDCEICGQARWGDVLVQPNPNAREFFCTECLVRFYNKHEHLVWDGSNMVEKTTRSTGKEK